MSNQACILSTKDHTILEVLYDRYRGRGDPLAFMLRRKLESAIVVFREDVPENVATLNSRVRFSANRDGAQTRIISYGTLQPVGMYIPITSPRGLALIGLSEGEEFRIPYRDGGIFQIELREVLYQPEKARREASGSSFENPYLGLRPQLKLV